MTSGGARARSGPPPDPNALRRERDKAEWIHLPAAGRAGKVPRFPLDGATEREHALWAAEWRRPQAIEWERLGVEVEVALYVRSLVAAEQPKASPARSALVLRHLDSLGISVAGLRLHRWIIDGTDDAKQVAKTDDSVRRTPAKSRFKTIPGGAA